MILARGEMLNVILPFRAVMLTLAVLSLAGGMSLVISAKVMRNSRDILTQGHAQRTFALGMGVMILGLLLGVVSTIIYGSQGGFQ